MKLLYSKTPIVYSEKLKKEFGRNCFFKLEVLQPTRSFKIRGIGELCNKYQDEGFTNFISSSGGNGGIAVAYAGMKLGIPTTVFIPKTSNKIYVEQIKLYNAEITVCGDNWDEANAAALALVNTNKDKFAYIPPFDHDVIWRGHSTIIDECAQELDKPDLVIVSVGGGGLACGILEGMHRNKWHDVPLITVETSGADCFYQSVLARKIITLPKITSKATSLGAKAVCKKLFEWTKIHQIKPVCVTDTDAAKGSDEFAKDKGIMTELAAGASLSTLYLNSSCLEGYRNILVIVCGGVNTNFLLEQNIII